MENAYFPWELKAQVGNGISAKQYGNEKASFSWELNAQMKGWTSAKRGEVGTLHFLWELNTQVESGLFVSESGCLFLFQDPGG